MLDVIETAQERNESITAAARPLATARPRPGGMGLSLCNRGSLSAFGEDGCMRVRATFLLPVLVLSNTRHGAVSVLPLAPVLDLQQVLSCSLSQRSSRCTLPLP